MSKVVPPEDQAVPSAVASTSASATMESAATEFFMWKNPMQTGPYFLGINALFYLIVFRSWTILGLTGVVGMLVLIGSFVLVKATGAKDSGPIEIEDALTERQVEMVVQTLNLAKYKVRTVLRCDDMELFTKAILICLGVTFVGTLFSVLFLLYVGVLGAFVGPVVYDKYQSQIDKMLLQAKVEAEKLWATFMQTAGAKVKELLEQAQSKLKGGAAGAAPSKATPTKAARPKKTD